MPLGLDKPRDDVAPPGVLLCLHADHVEGHVEAVCPDPPLRLVEGLRDRRLVGRRRGGGSSGRRSMEGVKGEEREEGGGAG